MRAAGNQAGCEGLKPSSEPLFAAPMTMLPEEPEHAPGERGEADQLLPRDNPPRVPLGLPANFGAFSGMLWLSHSNTGPDALATGRPATSFLVRGEGRGLT